VIRLANVLNNVVQESNVGERRTALFPPRGLDGRTTDRRCHHQQHEDMHGGEAETSLLLATAPQMVRSSYRDADFTADERRNLLTTSIRTYSETGIIDPKPSLATAKEGQLLLDAGRLRQWKHALRRVR